MLPAFDATSVPSADILRRWDNQHVWHPFTPMDSWVQEDAPIICDADGFDLIDVAGNRYLDGISSLWCNVHGHNVEAIDSAIRQQLSRVSHSTLLGLANDVSIQLARILVELTPVGLNRVFYSDSGATAVEVALKLAYQYHHQKPFPEHDRDTFICVGNAYHGDTIGSVSVGSIDVFHRTYRHLLFSTLTVPSPVTTRISDGHTKESWLQHCYQEVEDTIRTHHNRVAGFVIEPLVQGAAGILVHPHGYLKHVRRLCTEHNIPMIADEVAVGFGRTGSLFACEQESVVPDLLCLAKGLTGGYLPLAATLATDEIFAAFGGDPARGRTFFHGHTYTGNPLGCAAAIASCELFHSNNVLENAANCETVIRDSLDDLRRHANVGEIRQKGLMVGIEIVANRDTMESFSPSERVGHKVTLAARRRGVILRPLGDVVVLMPAPGMPPELVQRLCQVATESIAEVTERTAVNRDSV